MRLDPDKKLKLDEQDSIVLNSSLTLPKTIIKLPTKSYADEKSSDQSILKNIAHLDLNFRNITNARFIQSNQLPQIDSHLTANYYVDSAIMLSVNKPTLLRLGPYEELKLDEQDSIILNSTYTFPETRIELPTKKYVDSLHESNWNRRDLSSVFNDQDNEFDNIKSNNSDSATVNRNPS